MTINEVFKHMTDIINYHLFPFLRTKHIEHKHRVFVEDFIRQLYDTLNTALKNPNNPRYKIKCDEEESWMLVIRVGQCPALPNTRHLTFYVQGDDDIRLTLSRTDTVFDSNRNRHERHVCITFVKYLEDQHTRLDLKATRIGQVMHQAEWVFLYTNERPVLECCTYKDYL